MALAAADGERDPIRGPGATGPRAFSSRLAVAVATSTYARTGVFVAVNVLAAARFFAPISSRFSSPAGRSARACHAVRRPVPAGRRRRPGAVPPRPVFDAHDVPVHRVQFVQGKCLMCGPFSRRLRSGRVTRRTRPLRPRRQLDVFIPRAAKF